MAFPMLNFTDQYIGRVKDYLCDDGFSPSLAMNSECQPDGNWQPDPAGVVCTASMTFTGKLKLMLLNEKVCAV